MAPSTSAQLAKLRYLGGAKESVCIARIAYKHLRLRCIGFGSWAVQAKMFAQKAQATTRYLGSGALVTAAPSNYA